MHNHLMDRHKQRIMKGWHAICSFDKTGTNTRNAMMWIVKIALRAPYTFTVLAVLLLIGGALSALQMAKDIFPAINIPVVGIIWTYNGLPAQEFAERITTVSERASTTSVNDIEHIESNSFNGIAVIKIYLHPGASIDAAIAEVTAECQTILKTMPPGATPPNILRDCHKISVSIFLQNRYSGANG